MLHEINERKSREQPHAYKNASKLITLNDENQNNGRTNNYNNTRYLAGPRSVVQTVFERTSHMNSKIIERKTETNIRLWCTKRASRFQWNFVDFDASEIRAESGKNSFFLGSIRLLFFDFYFIRRLPRILWQFTNSSLFSHSLLAARSKSNSIAFFEWWDLSRRNFKLRDIELNGQISVVQLRNTIFFYHRRARASSLSFFNAFVLLRTTNLLKTTFGATVSMSVALQMTTFNLLIQMKRLRLTFFCCFLLSICIRTIMRENQGGFVNRWIRCERIWRLVVDWLNKRECLICRWSRTTK